MENQIQLSKETLLLFINHLHDKKEKVSAKLVVKSKKTGIDFTYLIQGKDVKGERIITIGIETDYDRFRYAHGYFNGRRADSSKHKKEVIAGAVYVLDKLYNRQLDKLLEVSEIYNTGRCIKCNRILTDLESIKFGMGKKCRNG